MAVKGRGRKPTSLKELEGNPGKRALNRHEPKPEKKAPKYTTWLDPEGKNAVVKGLRRLALMDM